MAPGSSARSLKHPGRWLWLVMLVPVVLGLARLRFDVEIFDLLPSELPAVAGLKLYQEHFSNARELLITLEGSSSERVESAAGSIAEHLRLETNLVASVTWEPPWQEHPQQMAELVGFLWLNQPPAVFAEISNRLAPDKVAETLVAARDQLATSFSPQEIGRVSYDPFGVTRLPETIANAAPSFEKQGQDSFSSRDGRFRIIFVKASHDLRTYRDCANWLDSVKKAVTAALNFQGAEGQQIAVGYTGRPAIVAEVALGMRHDVIISVGGTAGIIALLFWLAHRRVKPMLWLLTLLALTLGSTLALGGLIFGTINVVSMGFAAILLGLAVDYAVVHYQEALAQPNLTIPQVRSAIAPSIFWAAVTTISAFLVLNFGGLPGLGQLGTLVGLGVALAAFIMIFEFLPPLFPERNVAQPPVVEKTNEAQAAHEPAPPSPRRMRAAFATTLIVILMAIGMLAFGLPKIDSSEDALRPRNSPAYGAMARVQAELNQQREPLWVIVRGQNENDVAKKLDDVQPILAQAASNHVIESFTLPAQLWPHAGYQEENRALALKLASERALLHEAAETNGFAKDSLVLLDKVLDTWQAAANSSGVFWPTNPVSRWIFEKLTARSSTNAFALGLINLPAGISATAKIPHLRGLSADLARKNVLLSGWQLLGGAIFSRVKANMWKVLTPMVVLVMLSLWLAFHRPREIILSLTVLFLSGLVLLTVMRLAHWSWNLVNLMAVPLVLGTGVDYSIFMQLALRRHNGDVRMAYLSVGRALLLCGGTAVAGFGSLALSRNAGMASLGAVCAVGVGSNMLIAIFLLPAWWTARENRNRRRKAGNGSHGTNGGPGNRNSDPPTQPSSLYRGEVWRVAMASARLLPAGPCRGLAPWMADAYRVFARGRREVVLENLLPLMNDNQASARQETRQLFRNFGQKLVDLWQYEAGLPINNLFGESHGWEHFEQARAQKRGILLLTPHLGNWEFGGPALAQKGVSLQVVTLAEPGDGFTQLRQASRARWQIETVVIGEDPFAFIDIIRRLESGATIALLVDRPPPPTAEMVELFGRPFAVSMAPAELARCTGCVLLPVFIPHTESGYEPNVLPPIPYDRAALRDRNARKKLTQEIIRVFEPVIGNYPDQWYHFIPIWPHDKTSGGNGF